MNRTISRIAQLLALTGLFVLTIGFARANTVPHLSGSYRVIHKADLGSQTRIRLQLEFSNSGARDLLIKRMTVWSGHHPGKAEARSSSFVIRTGASSSTTQEFTIPRSEYRSLSHGTPLTLLVAVEGPEGRKAVELVRLDPISRGKAN